MILLDLEGIKKSFMGIEVLHGVDLQLEAGEIHCLVGENGAGKSTLVKILSGVYPDYSGKIAIKGKTVRISNPRLSRAMGIGAVHQHRDLVPTLDAVENIFLGNEIIKKGQIIDKSRMREEAIKLVSRFNVPVDLDCPVRELKVSEQTIVAICKALSTDCKILLIDEATASLDDSERKVLFEILKVLRNEGHGILYISHHLEEIFDIGDRVTVLRNGKRVWTKNVCEFDTDDLIDAMTGNKKIYKRMNAKNRFSPNESPILEFKNVNINGLVRNISFSARKGEIIGFAGLLGSNKEKIAETVFGLVPVSAGCIYYKNNPIRVKHPLDAIRLGIGLVPGDRQQAGLVPCCSVIDNISLAFVNKIGNWLLNLSTMNKISHHYIKTLGIRLSSPNQRVEYLSGGNQQKVLLSKWLAAEVEVLFLIEPTEGIDVGARADLYNCFTELAKEGKTLVVFSSDIDELLTLCDRIYTMVEGEITNEYDPDTVDKRTILAAILKRQKLSS